MGVGSFFWPISLVGITLDNAAKYEARIMKVWRNQGETRDLPEIAIRERFIVAAAFQIMAFREMGL